MNTVANRTVICKGVPYWPAQTTGGSKVTAGRSSRDERLSRPGESDVD